MKQLSIYVVYLIHFEQPVQRKRHYIGSTTVKGFDSRMRAHSEGYGANLTRAAFKKGVPFHLVATWWAPSREFEKDLKLRSHANGLCPLCQHERHNPHPSQENPGVGAAITAPGNNIISF